MADNQMDGYDDRDTKAEKDAGTQPVRGDVKEQTGGAQEDQRSGQTPEGARNQDHENCNPTRPEPARRGGPRRAGYDH